MNQFTKLITSEHRDKPKFVATVSALTAGFADTLAAFENLPTLFFLETAQGNQLDLLGQWIGASRIFSSPVGDYFEWDVLSMGWDDKRWWELGEPVKIDVQLKDTEYRNLLKARIIRNSWKGDAPGLTKIIYAVIGGSEEDNPITITDGDMGCTVIVGGEISSANWEVLNSNILDLQVLGVTFAWSIGE